MIVRPKVVITDSHHVCPWWLAYTFDNPIRRLFHQPDKLLGAYVHKGKIAMDVGCGMGFFSIRMARMVGEKGRVFAVDLQEKMLEVTLKRAARAGVRDIISPHRCSPDKIDLNEKVDFVLAFWMVHEVKDQKAFLDELRLNLAAGGKILVAEPKMHVSPEAFQKTLEIAQTAGLRLCGRPAVRFSLTALFEP